jgi:hypothetical protein
VVVEDTVIVEDTSHTTVLEEYLVERVVMEDTVDAPQCRRRRRFRFSCESPPKQMKDETTQKRESCSCSMNILR